MYVTWRMSDIRIKKNEQLNRIACFPSDQNVNKIAITLNVCVYRFLEG